MERADRSQKKKHRHQLKQTIRKEYQYMTFLIDEMKNDTSKVDCLQSTKSNYQTLIEDIVGHYQTIQDFQSNLQELLQQKKQIPTIEKQHDSESTELFLDFDLAYMLKKYPISIPSELMQGMKASDHHHQERGQLNDAKQELINQGLQLPSLQNRPPRTRQNSVCKASSQKSVHDSQKTTTHRKDSLLTFKALVSEQKQKVGSNNKNPALPKPGGPPKPVKKIENGSIDLQNKNVPEIKPIEKEIKQKAQVPEVEPQLQQIQQSSSPFGNITSSFGAYSFPKNQIQQNGRNENLNFTSKQEGLFKTVEPESKSLVQAISSHSAFNDASTIQGPQTERIPYKNQEIKTEFINNIDQESLCPSSEYPSFIKHEIDHSEDRKNNIKLLKKFVYHDRFIVETNNGDVDAIPKEEIVIENSNKNHEFKESVIIQECGFANSPEKQSEGNEFGAERKREKQHKKKKKTDSEEHSFILSQSQQKQKDFTEKSPPITKSLPNLPQQPPRQSQSQPRKKPSTKMSGYNGKYAILGNKEKKVSILAPKRLQSNNALQDQNIALQKQLIHQHNNRSSLQHNNPIVMTKRNKEKGMKKDESKGEFSLPRIV